MYLARVCRVAWLLPGDKLVGPTSPNCSRWSPVSRIVAVAVRLKVCNAPILSVPNATCMHAMSQPTHTVSRATRTPSVHIAAASCSCLLRGRREPPSRRRRPLPCPRRLPRCLPRSGPQSRQSRHHRLRGHTAVALAASSQSRRFRRPCSRRCELRPSELSPSPPPSRARASPSPTPSLVAHAAASCHRRTVPFDGGCATISNIDFCLPL